MRRRIKYVFIPHHGNNYKPALFEYAGLSVVLAIGIIFFISSAVSNRFIVGTSQGAAVYSSVLIDLANQARIADDGPALVVSETLTKAAQLKAEDMAARQYFSHTSPDGTTPWYWFQKAGYNFVYAGENLAVDFTESADIQNAWLASPKHKENIIDPRFREIGVATKTATWQGRQTTFVVQLFGTPSDFADSGQDNSDGIPIASAAASSPEVLGTKVASATPEENTSPTPKKQVRIISENPSVIVAQNISPTPSNSNTSVSQDSNAQNEMSSGLTTDLRTQAMVSPEKTNQLSTFLQKALVRMPHISNYALVGLALMLLLGLILFIFVEIRRQHPWQVVLGVFTFVALSSLAYMSKAFVLPM